MTDHLPECVCYNKVHAHKCALCICDRLRACEQRMDDRWSPFAHHKYRLGYKNGVLDAREAVSRGCSHIHYEGCLPCEHTVALAAIDALREKP